jgi:hypothetical protein
MKTFVIEFDPPERFQLLMYRGDVAPTPADIRAALKRRRIPERIIACATWNITATRYDLGGGKTAARAS